MGKTIKYDEKFDYCYGNGETALAFKSLEPKFSEEFEKLTLELLVNLYIRYEMLRDVDGRSFTKLCTTWRLVAEELNVLYDYPYNMNTFPHTHPYSKQAALEAKKRLGITF